MKHTIFWTPQERHSKIETMCIKSSFNYLQISEHISYINVYCICMQYYVYIFMCHMYNAGMAALAYIRTYQKEKTNHWSIVQWSWNKLCCCCCDDNMMKTARKPGKKRKENPVGCTKFFRSLCNHTYRSVAQLICCCSRLVYSLGSKSWCALTVLHIPPNKTQRGSIISSDRDKRGSHSLRWNVTNKAKHVTAQFPGPVG